VVEGVANKNLLEELEFDAYREKLEQLAEKPLNTENQFKEIWKSKELLYLSGELWFGNITALPHDKKALPGEMCPIDLYIREDSIKIILDVGGMERPKLQLREDENILIITKASRYDQHRGLLALPYAVRKEVRNVTYRNGTIALTLNRKLSD